VIDDAQLALAVVAADLVDRQGVHEPERLPVVGCHHEAAGLGLVVMDVHGWFPSAGASGG
jgi:hypothetical protein